MAQTATFPALVYKLIDREHPPRLEQRASSGLARSRFRLFSTAKGHPAASSAYGDAKRVDEALRLALAGYRGVVTNTGGNALFVNGVFPGNSIEFYDDPTQTWQVASEFDFWAQEALPIPLP